MKKKFNGVHLDVYLSNSIEPWQRAAIAKVEKRAYLLGRKHQKEALAKTNPTTN